ncbi:hypothetical protein [Shewanella baltica]|uniref:hypothetical protein n=1 Tax=Shewanella baltica TaxID=62322 RepID=UPI00217CCEEB|nr:hypothetical protein [Shewanella baltica]MCS6192165.1 hypothetical protein [Shewanella baltica]
MSLGKQEGINAQAITKPIQLLAAWLVGLIFVNGTFLITAQAFNSTEWLAAILVIASIINVPLFLVALFLLQTKFRPEIQEDHYYSQYIKDKLGRNVTDKSKSPEIVHITEATEDNVDDSIWSKVKIMFNPHLKLSDEVRANLEKSGIPITEEFGGKHWIPEFVVAIGRYLTYEQISTILESIKNIPEVRVSFSDDDDEIYQWDRTVLIGSYYYDVDEKSYPISKAMELLEASDGNVNAFYQELFDRQRDEDA